MENRSRKRQVCIHLTAFMHIKQSMYVFVAYYSTVLLALYLYRTTAKINLYNYCSPWNDEACPKDWTFKFNKCYKTIAFNVPYASAKVMCQEKCGSTLLTIGSKEENDFAIEQAANAPLTSVDTFVGDEHVSRVWLSIESNLEVPNIWRWADGSHLKYSNWACRPNDFECAVLNYFVSFDKVNNGEWNTIKCSNAAGVMCQMPAQRARGSCIYDPETGCPEGWSGAFRYCHKVMSTGGSFFAGETLCSSNCQSYLPSIHSKLEHETLVNSVLDANTSQDAFWLGMMSLNEEAFTWRWSDGSPVDYSRWQPPSSNFAVDKHCVKIVKSLDAVWEQMSCLMSADIVCQIPRMYEGEIYASMR